MTIIGERIASTKTFVEGVCFPFFQIFLFVRLLFEYVNNSSLSLHADFYLQIQDSVFGVWIQAVERHKLSAECKSEHGVQLSRRMVIHHLQGLLRSYILTVSAFPLCCKQNLHPFCLLRGKEIVATKMFPEEWLIFTLQEFSRIATSTNHCIVVFKTRKKKYNKCKAVNSISQAFCDHIIIYSACRSHYQIEIRSSNEWSVWCCQQYTLQF